jgi:23S rRNA pseudouridine2605 synthase
MRLQKFIAERTTLSRRKAETAIEFGRVSVNGEIVTKLGTTVAPESDVVLLDGRPLENIREARTVVGLHKPIQVITSRSDPHGRQTVVDLLPPGLRNLKPVGRLDFMSEGLILLTNDGELANRIQHPSHGVKKSYRVWVKHEMPPDRISALQTGVPLEDGPGRFDSVVLDSRSQEGFAYRIVVSEGRNRFIRRMMDAVGHPVARLMRIGIGGLSLAKLGNLKPGEHRVLEGGEISLIEN